MVKLSGAFLTHVVEGPYSKMPKWIEEMDGIVATRGAKLKKRYAWYTTCPKCAKTYGKNYVVMFAELA